MKLHVDITFIITFAIVISQSYFGWRKYYRRDEKSYNQYRIVSQFTAVLLFVVIIAAIFFIYPNK